MITLEEARQLKKAGSHYFVCHGRAIVEIPSHVLAALTARACAQSSTAEMPGDLRVVDQTAKAGVKHKPTRIGPGRPRLAFS